VLPTPKKEETLKVQLLITCLLDSLFPETGEAVVRVLNRAGLGVEFPPGQTCCGQPAFNAGFWDEARAMAWHTIQVFAGREGPVVVPSGSCTAMIRHGYLELFAGDPEKLNAAQALAGRTYELSEFLVDEIQIAGLPGRYEAHLAYHPSCHLLRGLGVERQPLQLLQAMEGLHLEMLSPECCGFGGVFSVDHAPISAEMARRKVEEIERLSVEGVVAGDISCLMQIEGALRRSGSDARCAHLASVLAMQPLGLR